MSTHASTVTALARLRAACGDTMDPKAEAHLDANMQEVVAYCTTLSTELARTREDLRRVVLYAEAHTNVPGVDDLCDHGAESGCCSACSQRGPVKT